MAKAAVIAIVLIVLAGGYFGGSYLAKRKHGNGESPNGFSAEDQPDIRGEIKRIEEGQIVIAKFEQRNRSENDSDRGGRDRFRSMSNEERQQMRNQTQSQRPERNIESMEEATSVALKIQ